MEVNAADDRPASFAGAEYAARLRRLREVMSAKGCDLAVVDSIEDINYLTGVSVAGSAYQAVLVPIDASPVAVLRGVDAGLLSKDLAIACVTFGDHQDGVAVAIEAVKSLERPRARIGLDFASQALTVLRYRAYAAAFGERIADLSNAVAELRLIKSAAEVEHMRYAAKIVDGATGEVAATARVGMKVPEVVARAAAYFMTHGASCAHAGPISAGRATGLHATMSDHVLGPGDTLHVELLPEFRGYSARLMRSVVMSQPTPKQLATMATLRDAQDEQLAAMRPGALASAVDAICRSRVLASGLRDSYETLTGYTLGLYGMPRMSRISDFTRTFTPAANWRLEAGMTFHMYASAGGLALSETVLVTGDGVVRLTGTPRDLLRAGTPVGST